MSPYLKAAAMSLVLTGAAACQSAKPAASPTSALRSSEEIARRIETVAEEDFGPEREDVATALRVFAGAYQGAHKYSVAEILYQRTLAIQESATSQDNEAIAHTLRELISLYRAENRWADVEPLIQRYASVAEKVTIPNDFRLIQNLEDFAQFYEQDRQYAKAEPLLLRALTLAQSARDGENNGMVITVLDRLARDYRLQGKPAEAEQLFKEALATRETTYGKNSPRLLSTLRRYAEFLREGGKPDEAEPLDERIQEISSQMRVHSRSSSNSVPGMSRIPSQRDQ